MKILAIGTSNNKQSINRALAAYTAGLVSDAEVDVLDIAAYEMPLFSDAREQALGKPEQAQAFFRKISEADALVVSFAEHNGSYTAAWKNLFDWTSRIGMKVFQHKPAVYLATSPGPGGAAHVLAAAVGSAPYFGAELVDAVSVPSFHENFDGSQGEVINPEIRKRLQQAVDALAMAYAGAMEEKREEQCA